MFSIQRKAITTAAVTMAAGLVGLFLGSYFAREIAAHVTESRLYEYASRLMADEEASAAELRMALAAIDASTQGACSAAEVGYFRALIFESEFLKDAGRMQDGKIVCSASLGRPFGRLAVGRPDFVQQDGTAIHLGLKPYANHGITLVTFARRSSYVVYTPLTRLHLEPTPMHFTETATDAPTQHWGRLLGEDPGASREILTSEGVMRSGDRLYATRCSIRYFQCFTAFSTIPEVIATHRLHYASCLGVTGVVCALLGLALSLLYLRNKGMEQQLRRAIRHRQIRVVYQPIVQLESGRIVGVEALARWTDEAGEAISPEVFVKLAEERGFVGELTHLVIESVLSDFGTTLRTQTDFRVSVNVTAADLSNKHFPGILAASLEKAGVPARSLAIEITESTTVRGSEAVETIRRLRDMGHSVHIDDFGTGYSSLAYLQDLAVDAIKIDRAFTQAIGTGSVTAGILPQILAMVKTLELSVIVEGVESIEQVTYLASAGMPIYAQGWLFGKPQSYAALMRRMAKQKREPAKSELSLREVAEPERVA